MKEKAAFIIAMLLAGCAGFAPEPAPRLSQEEWDREEGLKNLAAIAELQQSRPPDSMQIISPNRVSDGHQDDAAPAVHQAHVAPSWLSLIMPSHRAALQSQRLLPAAPSMRAPPRDSPSPYPLNPSLVPPYTVFTPAGSAVPGSMRCVPDYLGGSRCTVSP